MTVERADAVVAGARCAGSAAAIALARAGRRVVALDRVAFPADTISTHLLWPGGVAELQALGALERVRALGAPPLPRALAGAGDLTIRSDFTPVDGIDHALCVRRTGLDAALVETARAAGAEVRERCAVVSLVHAGGRVAGVRYSDADGGERELRAPLVVGADGRRSTVARLARADPPYRASASGRACFYAYWEDARTEWQATAAQWRSGAELGTAFPCDGGLTLVLLQPPEARVGAFPRRPRGRVRAHGRSDPRPARAAGWLSPGEQGPQRDRDLVVLPAVGRTGLGAGRRRRPLQGPGDGAGDSRRAALRPATR